VKSQDTGLPQIVSQAQWQMARDKLLVKEKVHTRAGDALAAERRRLPMVKIDKEYVFDGPNGNATLFDLFREETILSTIKIRKAGFADCIDTHQSFRRQLTRLRDLRIIP
jgi:predicted dithiol-disulfide oxidoreductase (DUF899 family)